jgi:multidrug transporter EmrE-like cation transporter
MNVLWFFVYVVLSTAGLVLIKHARPIESLTFVAGCALYAAGFVLWLYLLRRLPLTVAFPCAAGALIGTTTIAGRIWLDEKLDWVQLLGVAAIAMGIFLVFFRAPVE